MAKPLTARLQTAEEARLRYFVEVDGGVPIEEVLDCRFWVNRAKQLVAGTMLELRAGDNAWYAEVLVLNVAITATGVHIPSFALLSYVDINKAAKSAPAEADAYSVKFNGADKFIIVRNADKVKIEKGIPTKDAAEAKLAELMAA
jgi:hypothetical protein